MFKIAVIGGSDSVVGFKALGLDTYEVDEATARADAEKWVGQMREQRLIID